jgi:hypothetical protein
VGVADEVRGRVGKNLVTGVLLGFVLATVPTRSESSTEASIKLLGRNHDVAVIEVTAGASELSIGETWRIVDKVGNHLATTIGSRSASPLNDTTALTPVTTSGKRRVRKWLKIVQPHETAMFVVTVRGLSLSEYVLARGEPATEPSHSLNSREQPMHRFACRQTRVYREQLRFIDWRGASFRRRLSASAVALKVSTSFRP